MPSSRTAGPVSGFRWNNSYERIALNLSIRIRRRGAPAIALLIALMLAPAGIRAQHVVVGPMVGFEAGRPLEIDRTWNAAGWCNCDNDRMRGASDFLRFGTTMALPEFSSGSPFGGMVELSIGIGSGRLQSDRITGQPAINPVAVNSYEFSVRSSTLSAQLDVMAHYNAIGPFGLGGGLWVGYPIFTRYTYSDAIPRPGVSEFGFETTIDGSNIQPYSSHWGFVLAPSYTYGLDRTTSLVGAVVVRGDLSPTGFTSFPQWLSAGVSVALMFDLSPPVAPAVVPAEPPATEPPKPVAVDTDQGNALSASIDLYAVDEKGAHHQESILHADTISQIRQMPLPDLIFFDRASAELPARFVHGDARAGGFSYASLAAMEPADIYRRGLDIIGLRMREHAASRVTLAGSAAGDEDASLAVARSERVRRYLEESWGIEPARIALSVARPMAAGGDLDRCVRIRPSGDIAGPLRIEWKSRRFRQPVLDLQPEITARHGVREWRIVLSQGASEIGRYSDTTRNPELAFRIPDDLSDTMLPPIVADLTVIDSTGATTSARDSLPLLLPSAAAAPVRGGISSRSTYMLIGGAAKSDGAATSQALRRIATSVEGPARLTVIAPAGDRSGGVRGEQIVTMLRGMLKSRTVSITSRADASGPVNYPEDRLLAASVSVVVEE
ncbi:MAG: OmpA/MotB domain protein [Chlorobi bacterium]|nr:OmpA/MotB domain protein [Chlorobiota bacterium]